jgi:predicted phosphate transport protein (TIGR00153 family)
MKKQTLFGWNIFKKTHELEKMITAFLLNIIQAGIFYGQAMNCYTVSGVDEEFKSLMQKVSDLEAQNDSYRRLIENNLYAYMILPDMRSDILRLLEMCDKVINKYESNLLVVSVEQPELLDNLRENLLKMIQTDLECVGSLVSGVRVFFDGQEIKEFTKKTYQMEHLVDSQALQLKSLVFQSDIELARKIQLKEFVYNIEKISDIAEDTADILNIMAVKHSL